MNLDAYRKAMEQIATIMEDAARQLEALISLKDAADLRECAATVRGMRVVGEGWVLLDPAGNPWPNVWFTSKDAAWQSLPVASDFYVAQGCSAVRVALVQTQGE